MPSSRSSLGNFVSATRRRLGAATQSIRLRCRRLTSQVRADPGFLIIGAQKSGTSSLFDHLVHHPMVGRPFLKEIGFFDCNFDKGIPWYRSHFPTRARMAALRQTLTGEATPYYFFHPLAPQRVGQTFPDVKLIVLLRNPVDRAHAHYQHERRKGFETLTFPEALQAEADRLDGEAKRLVRDPGYVSLPHRRFSYFSRGIYVRQLRNWMEALPADNFLVLQSESLFQNPSAALREILAFLGLPVVQGIPDFRNVNKADYPALDPRIRQELSRLFEPYNKQLYSYLRKDLGWQ